MLANSALVRLDRRPGSHDELDNIRLYTCMVGPKPTHASFYVNEVAEVEAIVAKMAGTHEDCSHQPSEHEGQEGEAIQGHDLHVRHGPEAVGGRDEERLETPGT